MAAVSSGRNAGERTNHLLPTMIKRLLLRIGYWLLEKDPPPDEVDELGLPVIRNASLEDVLDDDSYASRMWRLRKQVEACTKKNDELSEQLDELPNRSTYSRARR